MQFVEKGGSARSHQSSCQSNSPTLATVVIGRNEGERLQRCLSSIGQAPGRLAYVDSGSTDDSLKIADQHNALNVKLDTSTGFSAAKARNAGVRALARNDESFDYVQFLDGDCELVEGWLEKASDFLDANPQYAVVCGRRRERNPDASIYNAVCDIEWNTPVGDAQSCGGDAMMRRDAFEAVGGFNEAVIAGEEPELCVRLRQADWKIHRLDAEMTLHDADMKRFSQWWARSRRAGYAYAQGVVLHGRAPERHWRRETLRCWFWAFVVPTLIVAVCLLFGWFGLVLLALYPLLWTKTFLSSRRRLSNYHASIWATSCLIGKFPEWLGQLQFWASYLSASRRGKTRFRPIEYKSRGM